MIADDLVKQKTLIYFKNHHFASLATSSKQNEPHAAIMGYLVDDNFNFYFISINNSRKLHDIQDNPQAGIAIGSTSKPIVIQGGGRAEILPDVKPELFEGLLQVRQIRILLPGQLPNLEEMDIQQ